MKADPHHIRGVNLGGWLVVEKWMTPSLFAGTDAIDEYTLMKHPDGKERIEKHRQTFITQKDFAWLNEHQIDLVRIPVGYWMFESVDGYASTVQHVNNAMKWAEQYGIRVLLCLHGAKGSQNGKDHSGKVGKAEWFNNKSYQNDTVKVLERIAETYKNSSALWGIELLNEPMPPARHYFTLLRFYRRAHKRLTKILQPGTRIVYHDAFQPLLYAGALWNSTKYPIMMDVHWYGFSSDAKDANEFYRRTMQIQKLLLRVLRLWQPVIVGEWSAVMPQKYLNDLSKSEYMKSLARNTTNQQTTFNLSDGWIYWTYKVEKSGNMWNFHDMVEDKVIDLDLR